MDRQIDRQTDRHVECWLLFEILFSLITQEPSEMLQLLSWGFKAISLHAL